MKKGEGLNDFNLIKEAMSKIRMEKDIFEAEYEINRRLVTHDDDLGVGGVVYTPSPYGIEEVGDTQDEDFSSSRLRAPVERSVNDGAAWRPREANASSANYPWWWYDFSNMWGDKGLTIDTLKNIMARVVSPKALMARAVVTMCAHLRNCAIVVVETGLYELMDPPFSDKIVWEDIVHVKLEWFMLVSLIILVLNDEKDNFTKYLLGGGGVSSEVTIQLTNVIESLPPWLLSAEWVDKNLYSWPTELSEETLTYAGTDCLDRAVSLSLLDKYTECKPGENHPIIKFLVNESDRTLRHRLSSTQAGFLRVKLKEIKAEISSGTQWLVRRQKKTTVADTTAGDGQEVSTARSVGVFRVFIKNEATVSSPLFFNASYRTCLLPSCYSDIVTQSMKSMLVSEKNKRKRGGGSGRYKWITLDLRLSFNAEELVSFWKNMSPRNVDYSIAERELEKEATELSRRLVAHRRAGAEQTEAIDNTNESMAEFLTSLNNTNVNAEKALFLTTLWKACADKIFVLMAKTTNV